MDKITINDSVLLGSWEEVRGIEASTLTKNTNDTEKLDGLILKGYEMKFGKVNENGEKYEKGCFDKFIEKYFVDNKLNMPVTLLHKDDIDSLVGRVLYIETNNSGFYFVVYIPKSVKKYESIKALLKEGILQGFSKEGWSTDYEYKYDENGEYSHLLVKEMMVSAVSLVATPANGISFEQMKEIANGLRFKSEVGKKEEEKESAEDADELFL